MGSVGRVALLGAVLVATGCGESQAVSSRPEVAVTYWPEGRGSEARSATLLCGPPGGSHPNPERACDAFLNHTDALDPVAPNEACTEIYGGPQVATLVGPDLTASFSRINGCEIARWDALAPLLELPG